MSQFKLLLAVAMTGAFGCTSSAGMADEVTTAASDASAGGAVTGAGVGGSSSATTTGTTGTSAAASGAGGGGGSPVEMVVDLPGGSEGIAFDDLGYSPRLKRIVVAAANSGYLDLVDPTTLEVSSIEAPNSWKSADEGGGYILAVDRTAHRLDVIDPAAGSVVAAVDLDATEPDCVRYVASAREVWITNPGKGRIEVLSLPVSGPPVPVHGVFILVPGGPEGLAIDETRRRAYVHMFGGASGVVDIPTRSFVGSWPTGCNGSHGIPAVDEARGLVFAGCSSATAVVLDADDDGKELDRFELGSGATLLAYSAELEHLYVRGDPGDAIAVLDVASDGHLDPLETVHAANRGHCLVADDLGNVWTGDADTGRLLGFRDTHPKTSR